jgi:flagellin-like protein
MRGITPIIAIILLMLITVSAAGAAFIWIQLVQGQIAEETQTGLTSNLMQIHGRLSIESAWNQTSRICMIIRNTGTFDYEQADLLEMAVYINDLPYDINTTTITGDLEAQDNLLICLCTSAEASDANCVGAIDQGYDYDGSTVDITLQPPTGTGDTYNNFNGR